jgi:hypothetical protein
MRQGTNYKRVYLGYRAQATLSDLGAFSSTGAAHSAASDNEEQEHVAVCLVAAASPLTKALACAARGWEGAATATGLSLKTTAHPPAGFLSPLATRLTSPPTHTLNSPRVTMDSQPRSLTPALLTFAVTVVRRERIWFRCSLLLIYIIPRAGLR